MDAAFPLHPCGIAQYCDMQEEACTWLGRWYMEVGEDLRKAKSCFEEALVMDSRNKEVAQLLRQVNQDLGMREHADELTHLVGLSPSGPADDQESAFAMASGRAFEQSKDSDNHSKSSKHPLPSCLAHFS